LIHAYFHPGGEWLLSAWKPVVTSIHPSVDAACGPQE
jgi:hypothetical protein